MFSRIFDLFLLALGVLAVAQAFNLEALLHPADAALAQRGELPAVVGAPRFEKRQGNGSESPDQSAADDSETPTPTPDPTDEEPTSPSRTPPPPTSQPPPPPSSTPAPPPTSSDPGDSNDDPEDPPTSQQDPEPTSTPDPITEVMTTVMTITNNDGSLETRTTESTTTRTPGLSDGQSQGGSSSGMSPSTRKTVIGVVVGIGGAVVLGALAFVAWRIWGRRRAAAASDDGLVGYNVSAAPYTPMDKSEAGSSGGMTGHSAGRNPFQSTLETYHAPTHVNASSNF